MIYSIFTPDNRPAGMIPKLFLMKVEACPPLWGQPVKRHKASSLEFLAGRSQMRDYVNPGDHLQLSDGLFIVADDYSLIPSENKVVIADVDNDGANKVDECQLVENALGRSLKWYDNPNSQNSYLAVVTPEEDAIATQVIDDWERDRAESMAKLYKNEHFVD